MQPLLRVIALSILLTSITSIASAQLAVWDVNGINAGSTNPFAGSVGNNIASASLTLGSGVSASTAANTFGGSGFSATSLATAISSNDYISFTVTPASNSSFSVSSISLNPGIGAATSGGSFNFALLSNATGFSSGSALWTFSTSSATPAAQSITLTSAEALQGLTSATEFRLYAWIDPGATGTAVARIRNLTGADLTISGSASAIPEPSTYAAIIGAVALGGAMWHRRRRNVKI